MDRSVLEKKSLAELREIASTLELTGVQRMKKADLVSLIIDTATSQADGGSDDEDGDDSDDGGSDADARKDASSESSGESSSGSSGRSGKDDQDGDDDGDRRGRNRRRRKGGNGPQDGDLEENEVREGVLDLLPEGYGFLRTTGYLSGAKDVYVSQSYVRRFQLRRGDRVRGPIRSNNRGSDKFPALARIETIEGLTVDEHLDADRHDFDDLTPLFPSQRLDLSSAKDALSVRVADAVAPLGRGQRVLVVAPPGAGTTTFLLQFATAVEAAHDDVHLMVVLVDERPEEVTLFEQSVDGEVISSTFDRSAEDHTQVAELSIERAKRLAERGQDVVVVLDSLTALTRAYNHVSSSGRTLPGGLDVGAVHPAKRFFGAARNLEEGGSITIVAAAADGSASTTDAVVLDELARTANAHVHLDLALGSAEVFPGVDVLASRTRREEQLLDDGELAELRSLRDKLADQVPADALATVVGLVEG